MMRNRLICIWCDSSFRPGQKQVVCDRCIRAIVGNPDGTWQDHSLGAYRRRHRIYVERRPDLCPSTYPRRKF